LDLLAGDFRVRRQQPPPLPRLLSRGCTLRAARRDSARTWQNGLKDHCISMKINDRMITRMTKVYQIITQRRAPNMWGLINRPSTLNVWSNKLNRQHDLQNTHRRATAATEVKQLGKAQLSHNWSNPG
jgi:hypothetical protein